MNDNRDFTDVKKCSCHCPGTKIKDKNSTLSVFVILNVVSRLYEASNNWTKRFCKTVIVMSLILFSCNDNEKYNFDLLVFF